MAIIRINTEAITDWDSFHSVFMTALGFPGFYGMNNNAWIDCMTDLREADDHVGMCSLVSLKREETLNLEIPNAHSFYKRLPEISGALIELTAYANQRYVKKGEAPAIALVFL